MVLSKKIFSNIEGISTSHAVGVKQVLLSNDETTSAITQIAVTKLIAGEEIESHLHSTMEEYFFFRKGIAAITISDEIIECHKDDFVIVPPSTMHILKAMTDIEVLTIGCAVE